MAANRPSKVKVTYFCQVDGCKSKLSNCKPYCIRYRVCPAHLAAPSVQLQGQESRFCQQCGKFHPLGEFDGTKRSCRTRLMHHNNSRQQRRKEAALQQSMSTTMLLQQRGARLTTARRKDSSEDTPTPTTTTSSGPDGGTPAPNNTLALADSATNKQCSGSSTSTSCISTQQDEHGEQRSSAAVQLEGAAGAASNSQQAGQCKQHQQQQMQQEGAAAAAVGRAAMALGVSFHDMSYHPDNQQHQQKEQQWQQGPAGSPDQPFSQPHWVDNTNSHSSFQAEALGSHRHCPQQVWRQQQVPWLGQPDAPAAPDTPRQARALCQQQELAAAAAAMAGRCEAGAEMGAPGSSSWGSDIHPHHAAVVAGTAAAAAGLNDVHDPFLQHGSSQVAVPGQEGATAAAPLSRFDSCCSSYLEREAAAVAMDPHGSRGMGPQPAAGTAAAAASCGLNLAAAAAAAPGAEECWPGGVLAERSSSYHSFVSASIAAGQPELQPSMQPMFRSSSHSSSCLRFSPGAQTPVLQARPGPDRSGWGTGPAVGSGYIRFSRCTVPGCTECPPEPSQAWEGPEGGTWAGPSAGPAAGYRALMSPGSALLQAYAAGAGGASYTGQGGSWPGSNQYNMPAVQPGSRNWQQQQQQEGVYNQHMPAVQPVGHNWWQQQQQQQPEGVFNQHTPRHQPVHREDSSAVPHGMHAAGAAVAAAASAAASGGPLVHQDGWAAVQQQNGSTFSSAFEAVARLHTEKQYMGVDEQYSQRYGSNLELLYSQGMQYGGPNPHQQYRQAGPDAAPMMPAGSEAALPMSQAKRVSSSAGDLSTYTAGLSPDLSTYTAGNLSQCIQPQLPPHYNQQQQLQQQQVQSRSSTWFDGSRQAGGGSAGGNSVMHTHSGYTHPSGGYQGATSFESEHPDRPSGSLGLGLTSNLYLPDPSLCAATGPAGAADAALGSSHGPNRAAEVLYGYPEHRTCQQGGSRAERLQDCFFNKMSAAATAAASADDGADEPHVQQAPYWQQQQQQRPQLQPPQLLAIELCVDPAHAAVAAAAAAAGPPGFACPAACAGLTAGPSLTPADTQMWEAKEAPSRRVPEVLTVPDTASLMIGAEMGAAGGAEMDAAGAAGSQSVQPVPQPPSLPPSMTCLAGGFLTGDGLGSAKGLEELLATWIDDNDGIMELLTEGFT